MAWMRLNIMGKVLFVVGFLLILSMPLRAQSLSWAKIYSDTNDDVAHSIAIGAGGYAFVTGTSANGSTLEGMVLKLDIYAGSIAWKSAISDNNNDSFGIAVVGYNNTIYAISTYNNGANTDFRTMQLSSATGSITASIIYDSGKNDSAFGLAVASDASSVYVVGSSFNGANDDWRVLKYNGSLTTLVWGGAVIYDGGAVDVARSCALDTYGNLYVTGYSSNAGMRTIRYDSNGAIVWNKIAGSPGDQALGAATDAYGNVIIAGVSIGSTGTQFEVIKYNGVDGSVLWDVTYSDGGIDFARGIATDFAGNAYVVGSSTTGGSSTIRIAGFRKADGVRFMTEQYGVGLSDNGFGIAVDSNLNFYVAGSTGSSPKQEYLILGFSSQTVEKHRTLLDRLLRKCGALGLDGLIFIGSLYWLKKRLSRNPNSI